MCVSVHEQHCCEMSGSEIQSRFTRHALYTHTYSMKGGSGKCERVEGYAFVINDFRENQGRATTFCLKPSERERAERCASERV